jgi:thioredoxin reductase (NADPH)
MEGAFELLRDYRYPILFLGVFLENTGIPVPGETAVIVAGVLASAAGGQRFNIGIVIGVTFCAAVLGDNLGFWLGQRWARRYLQAGRRFLFLTPKAMRVAEVYFQRYGMWTIFFARFVTALRVFAALAAGTAGMPWARFLIANSSGALLWATVISLLGFFFGKNLSTLEHWLGWGGLTALVLFVIIVAIWIVHGGLTRLLSVPALTEQGPDLQSPTVHERQETGGNVRMAEKVVIIGSGPAGWAAAIYAARANLQPVVYEGAIREENRLKGTLPLGQLALTTEVENYPGFPAGQMAEFLRTALPPERQPYWVQDNQPQAHHTVQGPEVIELMRQQAINFGTRVVTDDIVRVNFKTYPFVLYTLEGGEALAHTVIIATGARANWLGLPSEEAFKNRGVSACAVCDGALPRFRNRPVVVIGGGDSAVEEGTYLSKFASAVYLVHRRDKLRASQIMQQRALDNPKIVPKWHRVLQEVLGNDRDGVTGVRLQSTLEDTTEELDCGGVFLAIGHTPNTDFLQGQVQLDEKGYVVWTKPQRTYTSVEGVFAAGDVADSHYRQAITAAGTGCMAALDAERWLAARGEL